MKHIQDITSNSQGLIGSTHIIMVGGGGGGGGGQKIADSISGSREATNMKNCRFRV